MNYLVPKIPAWFFLVLTDLGIINLARIAYLANDEITTLSLAVFALLWLHFDVCEDIPEARQAAQLLLAWRMGTLWLVSGRAIAFVHCHFITLMAAGVSALTIWLCQCAGIYNSTEATLYVRFVWLAYGSLLLCCFYWPELYECVL